MHTRVTRACGGTGGCEAQQRRARAGHGPLRGGWALGAKFEGIAVLALGGAEMAAGRADHGGGVFAVQKHASQAQAFGHGGTGAIKPDKGDPQLPRGKGGGDDLVEQIAAEKKLYVFGLKAALLDGPADGIQIEAFFRQLKGVLTIELVLGNVVKQLSQRPLALFFTHKGRRCAHGGTERKINGLQTGALERHGVSSQRLVYRKNRA